MPGLFLCMQSSPTPTPQRPGQSPKHPTFPLLQLKCTNLRYLQQIHAQMITTGFIHHTTSLTKLLSLSLSAPSDTTTSLAYACKVFNHTHQPSTVIWNTILKGLVDHHSPKEAILGYVVMLQDPCTPPDNFTFPCLLKACAQLLAFSEGKTLHGQAVKLGLDTDLYIQATLIAMYSASGDVDSARQVFDDMGQKKNKIVWTSMISGYSRNRSPRDALLLLSMMEEEGLEADEVTVASALSACAELKDLDYGKNLHSRIRRFGMRICVVLGTALVDMYAKCGEIGAAREVFDALPERNVLTWSAMISGHAQNNQSEEALRLFKKMVAEDDNKPNEITIMAVLSACAQTGDLSLGKWVHAYIDRTKMDYSVGLNNSLVDMYSKCGKIDVARKIFQAMQHKNVVSWNVMISGLALHGLGEEALAQFSSMQQSGIRPDDITFVGVLSSCSHGGLVKEGFNLFQNMEGRYGITPKLEHYGCMTDLLSRAGMLEEAETFVREMPMKPNGVVWGALLSGCRVYNNVKVGERAAEQLIEIEPDGDGAYVLLSNIFARRKQWEELSRVRRLMHERGIRKAPGCSSIVVDGVSHEFTIGDRSHRESEDIYAMLNDVDDRLRAAGYIADTSQVLLNIINEEERESLLSQHSEKLALCFGLLKTRPGDEILILKNLRVCGDCHSAVKLISKLFQREITIRDRSRFHHFKDGSCSCKDFW